MLFAAFTQAVLPSTSIERDKDVFKDGELIFVQHFMQIFQIMCTCTNSNVSWCFLVNSFYWF